MNNENSLNSEKIDSEYYYNSQDSKQSRMSARNSNRETVISPFDSNRLLKKQKRGSYSRSLDSGIRFDKNSVEKDKDTFDENSFSEIEHRIKRAPKNFVAPGHLPKQSIRTVKGNLYEALNNINKELNVKIEKREIPKIRMSLLDYIDNNSEEQHDFKKGSKRIDIEDVMVNLSNIVKRNQQIDPICTAFDNKTIVDADAGIDAEADEMNIENILENSNLNQTNSCADKLLECGSNNFEVLSNMNSENQTLYFSGLRLAHELDKNKSLHQMHSNYSSITGKPSNIPYNKKKRNLKSLTIEDELDKYSVKNVGYNSGAPAYRVNIEEQKVRCEIDVSSNQPTKTGESVYIKNRVSPIRKNIKKEPDIAVASNFDSNFESMPQIDHSININENIVIFDSNSVNDLKEKEIFESLIRNDVVIKSQLKKNSVMSMSDNTYKIDLKQLLKFMKMKEIDVNSLKSEIAFLKNDIDNKNNLMKSYETKKEITDTELKSRIRELESQLSLSLKQNSRLEKENGILKNELVNSKKNKNFILKRFNEEMLDINTLTREFFDNFVSLEK